MQMTERACVVAILPTGDQPANAAYSQNFSGPLHPHGNWTAFPEALLVFPSFDEVLE